MTQTKVSCFLSKTIKISSFISSECTCKTTPRLFISIVCRLLKVILSTSNFQENPGNLTSKFFHYFAVTVNKQIILQRELFLLQFALFVFFSSIPYKGSESIFLAVSLTDMAKQRLFRAAAKLYN